MAMKAASIRVAGLAVAALSITPATAAPPANAAVTGVPSAKIGCSFAAGFRFSSTCRDARFKSYDECTTAGTKMGYAPLESYWYCSSLGLKN
jgi:hypothetical protein